MFVIEETSAQGPVLQLQGEWLMRNSRTIHGELTALLDQQVVGLDASKIEDIDSAGLQLLLAALRTRQKSGLSNAVIASSGALDSLVHLYGLESEFQGGVG